MLGIAGVVAAIASVGALFFAWRTVVEARASHAEDERDRRLGRIERLALALTELSAELQALEGANHTGAGESSLGIGRR
jgi:hypothetical protein